MENQNENQNQAPVNSQTAPSSGVTEQTPVVNQSVNQNPVLNVPQNPPVSGQKKTPKDILKGLVDKYKSASKNVKLLVIVGVVFLFSLLLLFIAALAKGGNSQVQQAPTGTAAPVSGSPLPQVEISNPSQYATDSGVLKIESDVDNISKEMDSVDLRQSNLRVPSLDFDVKFK